MLFEFSRTNTILFSRNWTKMIAFYLEILQLSPNYQNN